MGFDPSAFPPIADAGSLQREAAKFKSKADRVEELAADSFAAWSGMPGVYEAPEASIVYGAFAPVRTSGQDLAADARTLKSAVETYAAEAESIKFRYETLISRWHAIEAQKASDDEWREDEDLVQEDNDILSDANALMAEYMAAQRACASKISFIYSGSSYVPTTQEGAGAGEVQFGFTGAQLNAAAAEGKLPWGEPTEWDAPWYRDTWDVVASFGKGAWSGVTGTVTGLWNMVNVSDWNTFSTTWKGIGTLAMDVAVVSSPGLLMSNPQRVMESQQRLIAVGKAAVHWDEWQEDPAYAAGATTFDLAAILATAGVGAATKAGSTASKIAAVSGAASKTGTAVRITGLGAAARTTVTVADLATDLKIKSLDLSTTVARESLGRLAPVASRMDDAVGALRGPVPAYAGAGPIGSRPFSDAVEAGMSRMESGIDGGGTGVPAGGAAVDSAAPSGADAGSWPGGGVAVGDAVPDGGSPAGEVPETDAPVGATHADGGGPGDSAGSADSGADVPKATVTEWNPDGTPGTVQLPNGDQYTVSMSSAQLAESTAARRDGVLVSAREHGLEQQEFEKLIHKRGDELTPEQAEKLVNIRHGIEFSNGPDTVFQKVLNPGFVEDMLANRSPEEYRQRMRGFISDGADTALLRTSEEVIDGLRLDYTGEGGAPGPFSADAPVHAVRFQTSESAKIGIPDELLRQQLPDGNVARDLPDISDKVEGPPHTSTGFTGSTVDGQQIIPEYATRGDRGVDMFAGAEMWRLNRAGEEVLVGIFDGTDWVRVG
ncbi:MAG TPA: hypothetical protein VFM62_06280 [Arthrobacter sp.]|nr:hypothetical protein [Arthrobacter sp.]